MWSLQQPSTEQISTPQVKKHKGKRKRGDTLAINSANILPLEAAHYFPASMVYSFGALPIPFQDEGSKSSEPEKLKFPHNVSFRVADWVEDGALEDNDGYDVIIA